MRNRENNQNCSGNKQQKRSKSYDLDLKLGYKDSNLEMTESESLALPFGDSPSLSTSCIILRGPCYCKYFF